MASYLLCHRAHFGSPAYIAVPGRDIGRCYQIKYRKKNDNTEYYLTNAVAHDPERTEDYVVYKDTEIPVPYKESMEIGGVEYNDVFMLRPNDTAEISFPTFGLDEETIESYSIVECGINTEVYESVKANSAEIEGRSGEGYQASRKDFEIGYATTDDRARVTYENGVSENAMKDLTVTKKLYAEDGSTELYYPDDDEATFTYRLYLATEFDGAIDNAPASMHTYHVKDREGNYCAWDSANQRFVRIGNGITDYNDLTDEQKHAASFSTSVNGSISKIPAGYTVEVREVLAGTRFKLVERPWEIPDGYGFQKYIYQDEPIEGPDYDQVAAAGVTDTVSAAQNPHVDVCNIRGWGLRVNKVWTDKDYMTDREAVYFALYTKDQTDPEKLNLVDGSVRRMAYADNPQSLYWYYLHLPVSVSFDDYLIREVVLENPTVNQDGIVTAYDSIEVVEDGGTTSLKGTQKGDASQADFTYTVSYATGTPDTHSHVRTDTVTNSRPGVILQKQDWQGRPLAGASFTLKDAGNVIGEFTSDQEGRITVAFLGENKDYTLTETKAPAGYHGLEGPMTIRLTSEGGEQEVAVSGVDETYYELVRESGSMPVLTIKNRPFELKAVKTGDSDSGTINLAGVHFELHREVTVDGVTSKELTPLAGFEDLVSGENGVIPKIDESLQARTYYLVEKAAPEGYQKIGDVRFTITNTGAVVLTDHSQARLTSEEKEDGTLSYTLTVNNIRSTATIRVLKVDQEGKALEGATFRFDGKDIAGGNNTSWTSEKKTGSEDAVIIENSAVPLGTYTMKETAPPAGYDPLKGDVTIVVQNGNNGIEVVARIDGERIEYPYIERNPDTGVWTIRIMNSAGVQLPSTGGRGTTWIYILGSLLMLGCGVTLVARRRIRLVK